MLWWRCPVESAKKVVMVTQGSQISLMDGLLFGVLSVVVWEQASNQISNTLAVTDLFKVPDCKSDDFEEYVKAAVLSFKR
jgi:hypothetical protein